MNRPKISIIVPVYNAERFLIPCIESLQNQTLGDCEFILINDGSRDTSEHIIETYMHSDSRIRLINQENQGVSMARNAGLNVASGEYIGFVDADDTVESEMFEKLYNTAVGDNCDVVISNFESEMGTHKVITRFPFPTEVLLNEERIQQEILPYFIRSDDLNSVCNKLFKAEVIKNNALTFPKDVALGEDGQFNIGFFSKATTMKYIDYVGYHYKETAGSATRNIKDKDYFKRAIEVYESALPDIYMRKLDPETILRLKAIRLINTVLALIHIYFEPSQQVKFIHRYKYVSKMIENKQVSDSLPLYYDHASGDLGRYHKLMLAMIHRKSTLILYLATVYSRVRNKSLEE